MELVPEDEWEKRIGRSEKQLLRYADGDDPPFSVLTALSVASGVPVDWLAAGRPTEIPGLAETKEPLPDLAGFARLLPVRPEVEARGGRRVERWQPSELAVSATWLKSSFDLGFGDARYAVLDDDGMAPHCPLGATVIVDVRGGRPRAGIYLVELGDELVARRLYRMPDGRFELTADADPNWRFQAPDAAGLPQLHRIVWVSNRL